MAMCYALLIRKNLRTIDKIPKEFRDEVQAILDSYDN